MNIAEIFEHLREFAKDYGSALIGAVGVIFAALYGGRELRKLQGHRIQTLERDLRTAHEESREAKSREEKLNLELNAAQEERSKSERQLTRVKAAFESGAKIWLSGAAQQPNQYGERMQASVPILLIANLKGGVGKTTLATNLAAYFERQHGERVLAIDLDYQGSMSSMLLAEPFNRGERSTAALDAIMSDQSTGEEVVARSRPISHTTRDSRLVECDDPFADLEMRLLIGWLAEETRGDIRYRLARILQSPAIQNNFDRVIIDAPPRITTGFINALCASTHLVVPFVLDMLSAERVGLFLKQVREMKPALFPYLALAGIVGTMKDTNTDLLRQTERDALREAKRRAQEVWGYGDHVLEEALIPRKQKISSAAGLRIAYLDDPQTEAIFSKLGEALFRRTKGMKNAA
jgi:cellulose biosynthesis protein BcsQ